MLFSLIILVAALVSTQQKVSLLPIENTEVITVKFEYPGASARMIDQEVIAIAEPALSRIKNVFELKTQAFEDRGLLSITFDKNVDVERKRLEVSTALRNIREQFPAAVKQPEINIEKKEQEYPNSILISVTGNFSKVELSELVRTKIAPSFTSLKGVEKVYLSGLTDSQILVEYNYDELVVLGISPEDIRQQIYRQLEMDYKALKNPSQMRGQSALIIDSQNSADLLSIKIKTESGTILTLSQICEISRKEIVPSLIQRINGQESVTLDVRPRAAANSITLSKRIKTVLANLDKNYSGNISTTIEYDSSDFINGELQNVRNRILLAFLILMVLIVFSLRSATSTLLLFLGFLATGSLSLIVLHLFSIEIHLYSLAGITISIGFILDNLLLAIHHFQSRSQSNINLTLLGTTSTTILPLIAITLFSSTAETSISSFAWVIIINLLSSLIVTYLLFPVVAEQLSLTKAVQKVKKSSPTYYSLFFRTLFKLKNGVIVLLILGFGLPFFLLPETLEQGSSRWLMSTYNKTFGSTWYRTTMRPVIDPYTGGALRLFSKYVYNKSTIEEITESKMFIRGYAKETVDRRELDITMKNLESILKNSVGVKIYSTTISQQQGEIAVTFTKDFVDTFGPSVIRNNILKYVSQISGIDWTIYGVGPAFSKSAGSNEVANYQVELRGYNLDELIFIAEDLSSEFAKEPRILKVEASTSLGNSFANSVDKRIVFNSKTYQPQEIDLKRVYSLLANQSANYGKGEAIQYANETIFLKFQDKGSLVFDEWALLNRNIGTHSKPMKLKDHFEISEVNKLATINRINQEYVVYLKIQYQGSVLFGEKAVGRTIKAYQPNIPTGYSVQGKLFSFGSPKKSTYHLSLILLIIILIYVNCTIFFNEFFSGLVVLSVIPVSYIGMFFIYYWLDVPFGNGGITSFVMVTGLAVNASMVMLIELKGQQPKGYDFIHRLTVAYRQKVIPIFLTTASTALGLLPFIFFGGNNSFWYSFSIGTIAGLCFSMLGLFLVFPICSRLLRQ